MSALLRRSGIPAVGDIAWGTHFCHFFETIDDLCDTVAPYVIAGLEQQELCFWLVEDLTPERCLEELNRRATVDIGNYLANGSVLFQPADEWYRCEGVVDASSLRQAWFRMLEQSQERGFEGLRIAGCVSWIKESEWNDFLSCEQDFEDAVSGTPMIVLCSYPLARTNAARVLDVAQTHDFALAKREGHWDMLETPALRLKQLGIRNRQQAAVAALGLTAVREYDLQTLLAEAATLAAETLGTGRSIVWQLRPEHDDLILRAHAGWDELPSDATIPLVPGSASYHAFTHDQPVAVIDVASDPRFDQKSWLLRQHGVVTLLSALVRGRDRPWGALSVHSTTRRAFTDDDVGFLQSMANVLALAIERNEHELAERREKEELRRFHQLAETIDETFCVFTADLQYLTYLNPAGERLVGRTRESLAARGAWLECVHPDDRKRALANIASRSTGPDDDSRIVRPDGSMRWVHSRVSVLRGAGDETDSICMVLQDVTDRREAEEERARLLRTAEAALAKLHAIESITDAALGHLSLDELLAELLARLRTVLAADHASVFLLDEQRTGFVIRAMDGFPLARAAGIRPTLDSPIVGRTVREGLPFVIGNLDPVNNAAAAVGLHIRSAMAAPLAAEDKIFGVVTVTSTAERQFTEDEVELLRVVADRVGPAIERGRLIETVRAARERLESLSRRLLSVQEEERRRLAIELHDELGQVLTAVKINLGTKHLEDAIESVDKAMKTVRDLALDLRPAMLDDLGLAAALRWYADRFAQQARVQTHLAIADVPRLDPGVATACFRVAQEALTNVVRHARAANVWIELRHSPARLELTVRDDGAGFDVDEARERAARGGSLGLVGMEERVSLAGGTIEIHSEAGKGTQVRAIFPGGGAG